MSEQIHSVKVGDRFGLWVVTAKEEWERPDGYYATCKCVCGRDRHIRVRTLTTGQSTSCGCARYFYSSRCVNRLKMIWNDLPADHWGPFEEFFKWAMLNGFRYDSKLLRHRPMGPQTPDNCYWSPRRKEVGRTK